MVRSYSVATAKRLRKQRHGIRRCRRPVSPPRRWRRFRRMHRRAFPRRRGSARAPALRALETRESQNIGAATGSHLPSADMPLKPTFRMVGAFRWMIGKAVTAQSPALFAKPAAIHADRSRASVRPAERRMVACRTRYIAGGGENRIKEQQPAERHFRSGRWIASRRGRFTWKRHDIERH